MLAYAGEPGRGGRRRTSGVCQVVARSSTSRLGGERAFWITTTSHDRLAGFGAGGEDYVAKPFEIKELLARLEVLLRRGPSQPLGAEGLRLDPTRHAIVTETAEATLTPTEFRMLAAIASHPGEVVRRRSVVAAAWPDGAMVSENTIDSFIRRIRIKLDEVGAQASLETVRGVGFRLR